MKANVPPAVPFVVPTASAAGDRPVARLLVVVVVPLVLRAGEPVVALTAVVVAVGAVGHVLLGGRCLAVQVPVAAVAAAVAAFPTARARIPTTVARLTASIPANQQNTNETPT